MAIITVILFFLSTFSIEKNVSFQTFLQKQTSDMTLDKKHPLSDRAKPGQKLCEMSYNIVGLLTFTSAVLIIILSI